MRKILEVIPIQNVYVHNNWTTKYMKQKLTE